MNRSESVIKLAQALVKAQKEMESAKKDAANPFFKSKYADYGAVLEACKGPLNNNGIVILQPHSIHVTLNGVIGTVETILLHESGEFISSDTQIKCAKENDPQALGSAISYARRYGLQSLVALPTEDDDGNAGAGNTKAPQGRTPVAPTKPVAPVVPTKTVDTKPVTSDTVTVAQATAVETKAPEAPARRRVAVATDEVKQQPKPTTQQAANTVTNNDQW